MQTDSWAFDFSLSVLVLSELDLAGGEFIHKYICYIHKQHIQREFNSINYMKMKGILTINLFQS